MLNQYKNLPYILRFTDFPGVYSLEKHIIHLQENIFVLKRTISISRSQPKNPIEKTTHPEIFEQKPSPASGLVWYAMFKNIFANILTWVLHWSREINTVVLSAIQVTNLEKILNFCTYTLLRPLSELEAVTMYKLQFVTHYILLALYYFLSFNCSLFSCYMLLAL